MRFDHIGFEYVGKVSWSQVLGPGHIAILQKVIQLFSLGTRLDVVQKPDLGDSAVAALFHRFGITFRPTNVDGALADAFARLDIEQGCEMISTWCKILE